MQKFIVIVILLAAIGGAIVYFTGNTEKVKGKVSGVASKVAAKSQGYKKEIDPEHKTLIMDYETSQKAVDNYAVAVRDALKQGMEAREEKVKLKKALIEFNSANKKLNNLGYLYKDQYDFNVKRINKLKDISQ